MFGNNARTGMCLDSTTPLCTTVSDRQQTQSQALQAETLYPDMRRTIHHLMMFLGAYENPTSSSKKKSPESPHSSHDSKQQRIWHLNNNPPCHQSQSASVEVPVKMECSRSCSPRQVRQGVQKERKAWLSCLVFRCCSYT